MRIFRLCRKPFAKSPLDGKGGLVVAGRWHTPRRLVAYASDSLALASLGIFGVVSYTTAQRRGEMGIRLALGATASDLRSLVLRQGLAPVLLGLVAGIAVALALGRALAGLLYGVQPSDPLTIAGVAVVLFAVSAIACYIPALRVSRADPMSALHYE